MPVFSTLTDVKKKRENGNYSKDGGSDSDPLCCCMNYEPRMACVNLQHLKGRLSSPFVKYVMVMRKLFCFILDVPKQI